MFSLTRDVNRSLWFPILWGLNAKKAAACALNSTDALPVTGRWPISSVAGEAAPAQTSRLHSARSGVSGRQTRTLTLQSAAPPLRLARTPNLQYKLKLYS